MKKLIYVLLIAFVAYGCNKVEPDKAKELVENLLNDVKKENYKDLNKYYSDAFNDIESLEKKTEKYNKLHESLGSLQSFDLFDTKENHDSERGNSVTLKYHLKFEKITVVGTFIVIKDDMSYKITFQNIENIKP